MAHIQQIEYCSRIRDKFPERFNNAFVLDIGSLDINGNNRYLFTNPTYIGIDIGEGNNVDFVCKGHEYKSSMPFDVIVSTECFEHDQHWKETLQNAFNLLAPDGLLLFTCATTGRAEHGTTRSGTAWASPFSHVEFNEYYKNLTVEDIRSALDLTLFKDYEFEINTDSHDLYFYGIKL